MSLLLLASIFVALAPYQTFAFTENEGIYGTVAQEMRHGARLYKDVWDHKPPLIYLEYEMVQRSFGTSERALHLAVLVCHLICALLILFLVRRLGFGLREAWTAAFFYAFLIAPPWFQAWTGQADLTMQPWLLASFILILSPWTWSCFVAGLLWSMAFFTKQTALVYLPMYLVFSSKTWLETIVEFILGADAIAAAVAAPFYFSGRLKDFWDAVWGYNVLYVAQSWNFSLSDGRYLPAVMEWAAGIVAGNVLWIAGMGVAARRGIEELKGRRPFRPYSFIVLWSVLALMVCLLSGRLTNYYFVVLLAPLAVLGGMLVFELLKKAKMPVFILVLALGPPLYGYASAWRWNSTDRLMAWYPDRLDAAKQIGLEVKKRAQPGDSLLAWTTEPSIYVYAGLPISTIKTPLVNHLEQMPEYLESVKAAFAAQPPRFVILSGIAGVAEMPSWIKDTIAADYSLSLSIDPYSLYILKDFNARNLSKRPL